MNTRADDCFARPDIAEPTIELATFRCSERVLAMSWNPDFLSLVGRARTTHQDYRAEGLQAVGGRDHRCWAFMDGVDGLGVVDPA